MASTSARKISLVLFLVCLEILAISVSGDNSDHPSCRVWSAIAQQLTASTGAQQTCKQGSNPCTRIDCKGAYEFSSETSVVLPSGVVVEIDYCFGVILNHCDKPLSLDFYMQVPERNVNSTTRVFHNTLLPIPGLRYNISSMGSAEGFLYFEMERPHGQDSVTFSVTVKVRLNSLLWGEVWPASLQRRLISEETVPVPPCDSGQNYTAPPLSLGKCHPPHWKKVVEPPVEEKSPLSGNLGRKCSETQHCNDPWLACNRATHICECGRDYDTTEAKQSKFCSPKSRLGLKCSRSEECPDFMHVKCMQDVCSCIDGYKADSTGHVCERLSKQAPSTTASPPVTNAPQPTVAPHTGEEKKKAGHSKMAMIAGSVVGGIIVLAGILLVAYFAIRRLRRPYRNRELLLENDSDGIM